MKIRHKKLAIAACFASMVLLSGCMVAPVVPPTGVLYSSTKAPLDVDVADTKLGSKQGESSSVCVFYLIAGGDASIAEAARNGGIKTVQHVDYRYTNLFFGLFQQYTTIVYGE